jgi:hypothetical protein
MKRSRRLHSHRRRTSPGTRLSATGRLAAPRRPPSLIEDR